MKRSLVFEVEYLSACSFTCCYFSEVSFFANMSGKSSNSCSVVIGDVLRSTTSEYLVQSFLGQGTYGLVAKCRNIATNANVAIKIIKNKSKLSNQTAAEVKQNS